MDTSSKEYRYAFRDYLRFGTPINLDQKSRERSTHYIWRTRGDGKVRSSHAANDGRVFAWDSPPSTGHPGEEFGCRCVAEPFLPQVDESIDITFSGVLDTGRPWTSKDFVDHYYNGQGRGVTLRQTGHLRAVVDDYWDEIKDRFAGNHIATPARDQGVKSFDDDFGNVYDMESIVFSLGKTTIVGDLRGSGREEFGVMTVSGRISFRLIDEFADPIDIGIELGGDIYPITDSWSGTFKGRFYADESRSGYIFQAR